MVDAAIKTANGRPLLLACQEFPRVGTAKRDAFVKACARPGVRLTITQPEETDSVAFLSSSALVYPHWALTTSLSQSVVHRVLFTVCCPFLFLCSSPLSLPTPSHSSPPIM